MSPEIVRAAQRFGAWKTSGNSTTTVRSIAIGTTHGQFEIPAAWRGQFVTLRAETADAYFYFSDDASGEVDSAATSGATLGDKLPAGQSEDFYVHPKATHLVHEGSATGVLRVVQSSGVGES